MIKQTSKQGDYFKHIGGDSGLYFDGKKWIKFQCVGCLYAMGLAKNRRVNGDMPNRLKPMYKTSILNPDIKHNIELHNEWIKNGKKTNL